MTSTEEEDFDLDHIRPDLAELIERHAITLDENRPASVERRRKTNQRTARENVADLVDDGSFVEYGSLAIAAQRRRRKVDDLIRNTPADGLISGVATVNARKIRRGCRPLHGDLLRLHRAGRHPGPHEPQEDRPHAEPAEQWRLPLVFYAEGGGGRPGDTDRLGMTGLDGPSFVQFAKLSGLVPVIGIVSGYCFAGNAAMLGCCDVIIATKNASIGMGGPAMIEGGGLGVYHPAEVGPGVVPVAERRHRHPGRGRGGSDGRGAKISVVFPGRGRRLEGAGPAAAAAGDPGKPPAGLRYPQRHRSAGRRRLGAGNSPRLSASA